MHSNKEVNEMYVKANSLYHHGIKGQRWGVRRFQNKNGSLTPAGRKRYDDGPSQKKQKVYNVPKNKSTHRLKLEEKYKAQGMSAKDAEQAAARRIRGEQYVAAAAAVTVTAAIAYSKYRDYNVDKVISSNKEFHRILQTNDPDAPVREGARYVAYGKNDRMKYRGIYGNELKTKKAGELGALKIESEMSKIRGQTINPARKKAIDDKKIYDMTIKAKKDIKVASEKRARETFEKLFTNDPEFRKNLADRVAENRTGLIMKKGMMKGDIVDQLIQEGKPKELRQLRELNSKEIKGKAYDLFNILLVDSDERSRTNQNKFYNALKEQGMNAVKDMNDKKYSGYKTKNPLIMFDGEFEYSKKVLSDSQIAKDLKKSMNQLVTGPALAIGASYAAAFGAMPIIGSRAIEKQAILYKREHPNTSMSDTEIRKMFKEQAKAARNRM